MEKNKHYVYSARTTEKGLALLNKAKGDESWDAFINRAVANFYHINYDDIALPPSEFIAKRAEAKAAKEAEKAAKKAQREAEAKERKAKKAAEAKAKAAKAAKAKAAKKNGKKAGKKSTKKSAPKAEATAEPDKQ